MDCLKETAETGGRKPHSDLLCNIPITGSESLNSIWEFFLYFHSDSAEFIMLQKVKYVKPKYLFQPLPEVQYYFLSLDYLMHLPSTEKEKHTYRKSIFLCLLLNKLIE